MNPITPVTSDVKRDVHKDYLFWPVLCGIIRKGCRYSFQEGIAIIHVRGAVKFPGTHEQTHIRTV